MTLSTHYRTLRSILQRGAIATLFQPIHSTDGRDIIGYEALSRGPSNSPLHSPTMLFAAARQCDRLMELDMLCRGLWTEMMPDFVKVDRHFIDGIHTDQLKQEFLDSMLRMSRASGATLVAEGVELDEELQVLKGLGAPMVQGFLLGRPQPYSIPLADQAMAVTHSYCG